MWDLRQDKNYSDYMISIGWRVDKVNGVYCYSKRLPLIGISITKIQRPERVVTIDDIRILVKRNNTILLYIEPVSGDQYDYYIKNGFGPSNSPMLPTKTRVIDLNLQRQILLSKMHYKTRYNIGLLEKKKPSYIYSKDIDLFINAWHVDAKSRGMYFSLKKEIKALCDSFGDNADILLSFKEKTLLGGVLLIHSNRCSYYMYAFSTKEGRKEHAPTGLVWECVKRSKKMKSEFFDFEGIYDSRAPLPSWKGFSRFKNSFGGYEVEHYLPVKKLFFPFIS